MDWSEVDSDEESLKKIVTREEDFENSESDEDSEDLEDEEFDSEAEEEFIDDEEEDFIDDDSEMSQTKRTTMISKVKLPLEMKNQSI